MKTNKAFEAERNKKYLEGKLIVYNMWLFIKFNET